MKGILRFISVSLLFSTGNDPLVKTESASSTLLMILPRDATLQLHGMLMKFKAVLPRSYPYVSIRIDMIAWLFILRPQLITRPCTYVTVRNIVTRELVTENCSNIALSFFFAEIGGVRKIKLL